VTATSPGSAPDTLVVIGLLLADMRIAEALRSEAEGMGLSWASGGRRLLCSLKDGVDFGLKFFAVITALFAVKLLSDQPELTVNADVVRLIHIGTVAEPLDILCPTPTEAAEVADTPQIPPVVAVACRYNDRVRAGENVTTELVATSSGSRTVLTRLIPLPGSDDAIAAPNLEEGVTGIVRPESIALPRGPLLDGPTGGGLPRIRWILQTAEGETERLPSPENWPADPRLEGCDARLAILVARYGPVACLVPVGTAVALGGSSGLPIYALELMQATGASAIDADALQLALARIESAFVFEARLTVSNEGKGNANSTELVVPLGFTSQVVEGERACPGRDRSGSYDFILKAAESCEVIYLSSPQSLADAENLSGFGATARNAHPWVPTAIFWTAIVALIFTAVFVMLDVTKPSPPAAIDGAGNDASPLSGKQNGTAEGA
jgi:hypothetical protein